MDKFDAKLNRDHLQQCLTKLLRNENVDAEFVAYYLLANLGKCTYIKRTRVLMIVDKVKISYFFQGTVRL